MKNKQLALAVKRIILALAIVICHILQSTVIPFSGLQLPVLLLLPLGIAIAMSEKEFPAVFYGILIGVLWDLASPVTDGLWALIFPVMLCIMGLLTHYTLRNTLLTALIFTLFATVLFLTVTTFYGTQGISGELLSTILTKEWLPVIITTMIISVPEYLLVKKTEKVFHPDKVTY